MGCLNEGLSVAEDGLPDPSVRAGSRMALQRRVLRLGKPPRRWKTPSFSESVKRKITEVTSNYLFNTEPSVANKAFEAIALGPQNFEEIGLPIFVPLSKSELKMICLK